MSDASDRSQLTVFERRALERMDRKLEQMKNTITVTVPQPPPSKLMPNQASKQGSWHVRARERKACREVAYYAALPARPTSPIAGPVVMTLHVAYPSRRANLPDLEATIAGNKAHVDGVVDAGILYDDDQVRMIVATHEKLAKGEGDGYTRMTFTPMEEA